MLKRLYYIRIAYFKQPIAFWLLIIISLFRTHIKYEMFRMQINI